MLMDWDERGMHVHLMCIAWQQDPPCSLPDDDKTLRKWCGHPQRWLKVRPQILRAWKLSDGRWVQEGLLREWEKQRQYSESRRLSAEARWGKKDAYALRTQSVRNALLSSSSSSKKNKTIDAAFKTFWEAYPKKKSKGQAEKVWEKLQPDDVLVGLILRNIELASQTHDWKKDSGKFIPHPATWLNAKGWEDELPAARKERIPL